MGKTKNFKTQQEPHLPIEQNILVTKAIGENWGCGMMIDNPYINYLLDLIDFNSFWFFEMEGYHKYGGSIELSIANWGEGIKDDSGLGLSEIIYFEMEEMNEQDRKNYFNNRSYGHPSSLMWRKFYFDVLKPYFL